MLTRTGNTPRPGGTLRSSRMSGEERREIIVRIAACEFSTGGYHGTTTERIARRAGISQPYVFRLFPDKKALFLACADLCFERLAAAFENAADGLEGRPALTAMRATHQTLTADHCILLLELQLYVASAAEPDIARLVNDRRTRLRDRVQARTGVPDEEVSDFFATSMYVTTLLALGVPAPSRLWAGMKPPAALPEGRRCGCDI
ncbi:TetR/AcrR family transcriptional regulator [Frankia sp. QA3]|uniref:TetR/AcrR family transcriptional regulator n=1 Tax=Frankia sp. QA3 TaxID=710111 RepID=UPI000269C8D1|nr:TetR/AcrR family transcriptional regulator [Frankia sp. QA3]EIV94874.1 transcriptional regulator [Frankia sp. QA3]